MGRPSEKVLLAVCYKFIMHTVQLVLERVTFLVGGVGFLLGGASFVLESKGRRFLEGKHVFA